MLSNIHQLRAEWDSVIAALPTFVAMTSSVNVALSSRHGTGLFASNALDAGLLAAFYPVDALGDRDGYLTWGQSNRKHFSGSERERFEHTGCYLSLIHI